MITLPHTKYCMRILFQSENLVSFVVRTVEAKAASDLKAKGVTFSIFLSTKLPQ